MNRSIPFFAASILLLVVTASALTAPTTDTSKSGLCVAISYCKDNTYTLTESEALRQYLTDDRYSPQWAANRMLTMTPKLASELSNPATELIFVNSDNRELRESQCTATTLIEIWSPECGAMPTFCPEVADYNIVKLPDKPADGGDPAEAQYLFQELFGPVSQEVYFKGAGFYTGCAKSAGRNVTLIAGNSPEALRAVVDAFKEEFVKTSPNYDPSVKYYVDEEWAKNLIVGFDDDKSVVDTLSGDMEKNGKTPMVILGGDGEGGFAKVLLKVGGGGKLTVVASADKAYGMLGDGTPSEAVKNSIAYQLFALLHAEGDDKLQNVTIYGCNATASPSDLFSTDPARYLVGSAIVVNESGDIKAGENGLACSFKDKNKGSCTAKILLNNISSGDKCAKAAVDSFQGNIGAYGVRSKFDASDIAGSNMAGGEILFISGLSSCATAERADGGLTPSSTKIPKCSELEIKKQGYECPSGETGVKENGYGLSNNYCACAVAVEDKFNETLVEEKTFVRGEELPSPTTEGECSNGDGICVPAGWCTEGNLITANTECKSMLYMCCSLACGPSREGKCRLKGTYDGTYSEVAETSTNGSEGVCAKLSSWASKEYVCTKQVCISSATATSRVAGATIMVALNAPLKEPLTINVWSKNNNTVSAEPVVKDMAIPAPSGSTYKVELDSLDDGTATRTYAYGIYMGGKLLSMCAGEGKLEFSTNTGGKGPQIIALIQWLDAGGNNGKSEVVETGKTIYSKGPKFILGTPMYKDAEGHNVAIGDYDTRIEPSYGAPTGCKAAQDPKDIKCMNPPVSFGNPIDVGQGGTLDLYDTKREYLPFSAEVKIGTDSPPEADCREKLLKAIESAKAKRAEVLQKLDQMHLLEKKFETVSGRMGPTESGAALSPTNYDDLNYDISSEELSDTVKVPFQRGDELLKQAINRLGGLSSLAESDCETLLQNAKDAEAKYAEALGYAYEVDPGMLEEVDNDLEKLHNLMREGYNLKVELSRLPLVGEAMREYDDGVIQLGKADQTMQDYEWYDMFILGKTKKPDNVKPADITQAIQYCEIAITHFKRAKQLYEEEQTFLANTLEEAAAKLNELKASVQGARDALERMGVPRSLQKEIAPTSLVSVYVKSDKKYDTVLWDYQKGLDWQAKAERAHVTFTNSRMSLAGGESEEWKIRYDDAVEDYTQAKTYFEYSKSAYEAIGQGELYMLRATANDAKDKCDGAVSRLKAAQQWLPSYHLSKDQDYLAGKSQYDDAVRTHQAAGATGLTNDQIIDKLDAALTLYTEALAKFDTAYANMESYGAQLKAAIDSAGANPSSNVEKQDDKTKSSSENYYVHKVRLERRMPDLQTEELYIEIDGTDKFKVYFSTTLDVKDADILPYLEVPLPYSKGDSLQLKRAFHGTAIPFVGTGSDRMGVWYRSSGKLDLYTDYDRQAGLHVLKEIQIPSSQIDEMTSTSGIFGTKQYSREFESKVLKSSVE